jgi:hypothetical protein
MIVETGTLRCAWRSHRALHGWSTVYFRTLLDRIGGELHTVDVDPAAIETSRATIARMLGNTNRVHFHTGDSIAFLQCFAGPIDILYLDSYDYDPAKGDAAARHQLAEAQAAADKLTPRSIVMVDDVFGTIGHGKGALSIPFLQDRGWSDLELVPVAERKGEPWFQAILRRPG